MDYSMTLLVTRLYSVKWYNKMHDDLQKKKGGGTVVAKLRYSADIYLEALRKTNFRTSSWPD
jgi:hypothetical protein